MAIITSGLLTALHTTYRDDFERGKTRAMPMWDRVATRVQSSSASNTYGWLGQFPKLREWVGDRVVKDMKAHGYEITNKTYEGTVGVIRDDIEDDVIGTYAPMFEEMGYGAATAVDDELWPLLLAGDSTLCYDGQNFFDTDHPVYANHDGTGAVTDTSNITAGAGDKWFMMCTKRALKPLIYQDRRSPQFVTKFDPMNSDHVFMKNEYLWGVDMRFNVGFGLWQFAHQSQAAITPDSVFDVWTKMRQVKVDGGRPAGVKPDLLVVGSSNFKAAKTAVENEFDANGATNPARNLVEVVEVDWLN